MIRRLWAWFLGLFKRATPAPVPVDDGLSAKNRAIRAAQREEEGRRRMGWAPRELDPAKLPEPLRKAPVVALPSGRAYKIVNGTRVALNAPPALTKKERLWLRRRELARRRSAAAQLASTRPIPIDAEVNGHDSPPEVA